MDPSTGALERLLRQVTAQVTTTAHGRTFEHLVEHWLRHDPRYAPDIDQIWLWDHWPGRDGPDCGIDLVVRTNAGDLWAVQAKGYAAGNDVTAADIAMFLAMSDRPDLFTRRILVTSADHLGGHAHRLLATPSIPVAVHTRADLAAAAVTWPASITDLRTTSTHRPARHTRRPYQVAAVEQVLATLSTGDRATVVLPCGTGKTDVGLWVTEDSASELVAILFPSLSLLAQTMRSWHRQASAPFEQLAVCSDTTVTGTARDEDTLTETITEAGITGTVTTAPDTIATWLATPPNGRRRVVFATYHSAPALAAALERTGMDLDLLIADEAHHCAGVVSGGHELATGALRARRRLFLTATPVVARRHSVGVISMDDPARFGPQIATLSYAAAIGAGHLVDWKLVVVAVDPDEHDEVAHHGTRLLAQRPVDAAGLGLAAAVLDATRTESLARVVTFHRTVRRARQFSDVLTDVAHLVGAPLDTARTIAGTDSARVRSRALAELADVEPGRVRVVSNARCLSEGVDVPSLDAVVVADPRKSVVDIVQMLGRVMRPAPGKTHGTILVPVMVRPGQDPNDLLTGGHFAALVNVLEAIKAYDARLVADLDDAARTLGAGASVTFVTDQTRPSRPGRTLAGRLVLPDVLTADAKFLSAFTAKVVEETTHRHQFGIGRLAAEHARTGVTRWRQDYVDTSGYPLGRLVNALRTQRNAGSLPDATIAAVEVAVPGFVWQAVARRPESFRVRRTVEYMLPVLRAWAAEHGSLKMAQSASFDGEPIGKWLANRRRDVDLGRLNEHTLASLRQIDAHWPHPVRRASS